MFDIHFKALSYKSELYQHQMEKNQERPVCSLFSRRQGSAPPRKHAGAASPSPAVENRGSYLSNATANSKQHASSTAQICRHLIRGCYTNLCMCLVHKLPEGKKVGLYCIHLYFFFFLKLTFHRVCCAECVIYQCSGFQLRLLNIDSLKVLFQWKSLDLIFVIQEVYSVG